MGKQKSPDPVNTINAQNASNRETAITQYELGATNQNNPWGSVKYTQNGTWPDGTPKFTQNTNLTHKQQEIFNNTQAAQTNLSQLAQDQSSFLGDYLSKPFEFNNQDAENWAYDLASPRLLKQQDANQSATLTRLANSGIQPGSAAYNAELERLTNSNSDQLNQLALNGRSMAFGESLATRNQPINEITALLSGSQVSNPATMSGATPQPGVAGTDVAGITQQNYQNQLAQQQGAWGGIGGLFGSAFSGGLFG